MKISIVIISKNRKGKLYKCLEIIEQSSYKNFEIVVVHQISNHDQNYKQKLLKNFHNIKYFEQKLSGKTKGLNLAIKHAKGDIIAFIDDDCIVDKDWLKSINVFFKANSQAFGVFGRTFPHKNKQSKNLICPATFDRSEPNTVSDRSVIHYWDLGQGNNMAFKREIFFINNKFKFKFKEWLGPGSIGLNGEDSDLIYRILKKGISLHFNPKMIVFHDRWLMNFQELINQTKYSVGLFSFYFYYLEDDSSIMLFFIKERIKQRISSRQRQIFHNNFLNSWALKQQLSIILEIIAMIRGLFIGRFFAFIDKLKNEYPEK